MKETIISCDICKQSNVTSYKYLNDREMDASGNGYVCDYVYLDLCLVHLQEFIRKNPTKELTYT